MASLRPSDHLRGSLRHRCGAEFLPYRLHPASQRELWPAADFSGSYGQRYLQVHGHLYHGVCGLHDWHVQPVLILPGSQVQSRLHHVSNTRQQKCFVKICHTVNRERLCLNVCQEGSKVYLCSTLKRARPQSFSLE